MKAIKFINMGHKSKGYKLFTVIILSILETGRQIDRLTGIQVDIKPGWNYEGYRYT